MILHSSARSILVDYNLTQITPFVYVSAENTARQIQHVVSNHISCVINVACELPQMTFPSYSGIQSFKYPIEDLPSFPAVRYFDIIADRIAANVALNRRTLLYCQHGRSRSITFILAYLIKHHCLPLSLAYSLVRDRRQLALPNVGFWTQLRLFESYQQQKNFPIQNSFLYGAQYLFEKIANGIEQTLTYNPMVNPWIHHVNRINGKSHGPSYMYPIR